MAEEDYMDYDEKVKKFVDETREFIVSDSLLRIIIIALSVIVHGLISLAGVLTNSVNVLVFIRLGLKDSMSVGLWALSFTDLAVSAFQLTACVCYLIAYIYPKDPIDPWSVGTYVFGWARYVGYLASCWITTIIALERCYCVVAPFRVKQVFTKSRCISAILLIYLIHGGVLVPIYAFEPMDWTSYTLLEKDENGSLIYFMQFQLIYTKEGAKWEFIIDLVDGAILSAPSQVLILLCSFWMVFSLKASSRVRKHSVAQSKEKTDNLSTRERRLVKVVILLAVIQTICNIPRFFATGVYLLLPGILIGAYANLSTVMWEVSYIFSTICCASNIIVYMTLNSNFRQYLYSIFNRNFPRLSLHQ